MEEPKTTEIKIAEWSKNKKITIYSIVGTICSLSFIPVFVPAAKDYALNVIKLLMELVRAFVGTL
jgi:hypothetical protein